MRSGFVFPAAILLLSASALGQTIAPVTNAVVVPTGKTRQVGFFTSINPDCTGAGDIDPRLIKQPQEGTVELEAGPGFPNYPQNNPRNVCNVKQVQGIRIKYTSKEGYIGKDFFEVEFIAPMGSDIIWKYAVTVK
jgi:hypothetical protein